MSDSEDADESQDRPDNCTASDQGEDPDIEESDCGDDSPRRVPAAPVSSGGSGDQDGRERSASSPASEEREPRCQTAKPLRSGGSSSSRTSLFSWLQNRTVRRGIFVDPARDNFRTMTNLYCSMNPAADSVNLSTQTHGAVFNLEYSPDG